MHMSLRNGNIGLAVAVAMMAVGALIVGKNASDTEMQLIFWPAFFTGIVVMLVMPRLTKVVPAPLVSVVIVTGVVLAFTIGVPTVGDQGELPRSLPSLFVPDVPLT